MLGKEKICIEAFEGKKMTIEISGLERRGIEDLDFPTRFRLSHKIIPFIDLFEEKVSLLSLTKIALMM